MLVGGLSRDGGSGIATPRPQFPARPIASSIAVRTRKPTQSAVGTVGLWSRGLVGGRGRGGCLRPSRCFSTTRAAVTASKQRSLKHGVLNESKAKQNQERLCARACSVRFVPASSFRFHLSLYLHMQQSSGLSCVFGLISSAGAGFGLRPPPSPSTLTDHNDATPPCLSSGLFVHFHSSRGRADKKKKATPMAGGAHAFLPSSSSSSAVAPLNPFPFLCSYLCLSVLESASAESGGQNTLSLSAERD